MINVTKTFLPPKEEYLRIIEEIWKSNQIANGGLLHKNLQKALIEYLKVPRILLTANGTLPLQLSLKALAGYGEVITTPFSYVATTSTIIWENCTPVFVDINPHYLTIDETMIEDAITKRTTAILATHVFGNPCNVEVIGEIARKYKLKVIYDAAHAFGVEYNGKSLFDYGDISTCSFHATKLFHTGEGGALFTRDENLFQDLFNKHNFGHKGEFYFDGPGINAKMSELQAGMGLAVLPYIEEIKKERKKVIEYYRRNLNFEKLSTPKIRKNTVWNYSYYPVIFRSENSLLKVQSALNDSEIYPRRYFYPSLDTLQYVDSAIMHTSQDISRRILCLPLYPGLQRNDLNIITNIVNKYSRLS